VASRGGLDIEKDVRIAPMDPPGMLAAMETKAVDGFATSLPFTTEAVVKGKAIDNPTKAWRAARAPHPICCRLPTADLHTRLYVHQGA